MTTNTVLQKIDDFISFTDKSLILDKDPLCVTHLEYIIPREDNDIVDLLKLKEHNAIIAGGAPLKWYQFYPIEKNDIDLWFTNKVDLDKMNNFCKSKFTMIFDSEYAITYSHSINFKEYKIQLIKRTYSDIVSLLNSFDITVCRIAFDGVRWHMGKYFAIDLKNKYLRVDGDKHIQILKRVLKYWSYGYNPSNELIEELLNLENISFNFKNNQGGEYENTLFF